MENARRDIVTALYCERRDQGCREAERAPGQYFGPGPVCLKVRRGAAAELMG